MLKQQKRNLEKKFMDLNLVSWLSVYLSGMREGSCERKIFSLSLQEEIYEAGIAEDMKELERRLESELAEQERRWSENDDPRLFN